MQWVIEIQVSCNLKQSTLGSSSTIHHPLTEVKGQKICSNGQQVKSVDCSSIFSPEKLDSVIQVSSDRNQSTLGNSSTILHYLTEARGRKFAQTVNKP